MNLYYMDLKRTHISEAQRKQGPSSKTMLIISFQKSMYGKFIADLIESHAPLFNETHNIGDLSMLNKNETT